MLSSALYIRDRTSASLSSRGLFHEVSHGLPSCPKLRLTLGDVVPECYVAGSRVIHHPLPLLSG